MPSLHDFQPPSKQSKRLMQLGFRDRQKYLKGFSRACKDKSSIQRVARPRSDPLHMLALCHVQQLNRRRTIWNDQRQKEYDRRDRVKAQYDEQIRSADPCIVAALEQEARADYDRSMVVIHRFNFGPIDVVGGSPLSDSTMQHSAHAASLNIKESNQVSLAELAQPEQQHRPADLAVLTAIAPWPPSATIRSTPRRPGAPSYALRINH